MESQSSKNILRANIFAVTLASAILTMTITGTAAAKSLYMIADIIGVPAPVHAYNVAADGTLTFQAKHDIPNLGWGPVGLAIDAENGFLFVTYERSYAIQLIDAKTMTGRGTTIAPGAHNLAGIVYDSPNRLLYCVDRGRDVVYVYDWQPETASLTPVPGSPFRLVTATAFGIAVDELNNLLYVANNSTVINVYKTSDWSLVRTISVSRTVNSIAIDIKNGLLYAGGGSDPALCDGGPLSPDNFYLTQYNLVTGAEAEVQVEPDAGVIGLAVDQATGLVYLGTGRNNQPGGDNLKVYNTSLNQIDSIANGGNSTGIVIPGIDVSYNPLNLAKGIVGGVPGEITPVGIGQTITYSIFFDNNDNDYIVTSVSVVDALPHQVSFVWADGDGVLGQYDAATQTYKWLGPSLLPGSSKHLQLVVRVNQDTAPDTIITNFVTIDSDQTPPTTRSIEAIAKDFSYRPLNLSKAIVGGVGEKVEPVFVGDTITYRICFDNNDNEYAVSNVSIIDALPAEVSFVAADGNGAFGHYDAVSHTYTWSYPSLLAGSGGCCEFVVRVNQDAAPGTVITNSVTIDSDQTPPTTRSVDAVVKAISYNPLNLSKSIVGAVGDDIVPVLVGDTIRYRICFDNNDNDYTVTNVSVVDTLPAQVSFVAVEGDGVAGQYDAAAHTYTWSYPSLAPGSSSCLGLVVRVNQGTVAGTIISNFVTIDSDQTPPTTKSVHAIAKAIGYNPLNLSKDIVGAVVNGSAVEKIDCVDPGDAITYRICFDNNDNNYAVTNVSIVDILPTEMSFVTADGDGVSGHYDVNAHTYTWLYPVLLPKASTCLELVVQVNQDAAPDIVLTNSATISSDQTTPTTAHADIVTCAKPLQAELCIIPRVIRGNSFGGPSKILAIVALPPGIAKTDVENTALTLQPGSVEASDLSVHDTGNRVKVLAFFDKARLIKAVSSYGKVKLSVVGKLKSGQSFVGEQFVSIAR
jgi:uncharacterized repeat protein (TIGR01451 family)